MQYESPVGGADLGSYVDPDPALGIEGSPVRAPAVENAMRELHNLIEEGGLTPDRGDLTQVAQAIINIATAAVAAATAVLPGTLRVSISPNPGLGEFLCNGAAVSRVTYADLFGECGEDWGAGDGVTTFNLPDLRGRALIVAGAGVGLSVRALGDLLGEEDHVITEDEGAIHGHDVIRELADSDGTAGSGNGHLVGDGNESASLVTITGASLRAVQPSAGGDAHNNMQPSAVINVFVHV